MREVRGEQSETRRARRRRGGVGEDGGARERQQRGVQGRFKRSGPVPGRSGLSGPVLDRLGQPWRSWLVWVRPVWTGLDRLRPGGGLDRPGLGRLGQAGLGR